MKTVYVVKFFSKDSCFEPPVEFAVFKNKPYIEDVVAYAEKHPRFSHWRFYKDGLTVWVKGILYYSFIVYQTELL